MSTRMPRRSPAPADRQRDPERTKARILEAAKAEFGAKGFAAARVGVIADRAGVNKQLISYYFGGKEGLYTELTNRWQQLSTDITKPEQPLDAVAAGFVMGNLYNRDWARLMMWANLSDDAPDDAADAGFLQAQVAELRRRQADGEIPDDLDPAYLLLALFAAASAAITLPRVARLICGADPESEEFTRRYADQLARLVRHVTRSS